MRGGGQFPDPSASAPNSLASVSWSVRANGEAETPHRFTCARNDFRLCCATTGYGLHTIALVTWRSESGERGEVNPNRPRGRGLRTLAESMDGLCRARIGHARECTNKTACPHGYRYSDQENDWHDGGNQRHLRKGQPLRNGECDEQNERQAVKPHRRAPAAIGSPALTDSVRR